MKRLREGGTLIAQIHQVAGRIFARKLKEHGIEDVNPAQGRILFALWKEDDVPIQDLVRRTSLGKSTLTSMLDRLEVQGFIVRKADPLDRRQLRIALTEKNAPIQAVHRKVSEEMTGLFYDGFSTQEIDAFEAYLRRIHDTLARHETAQGRCDPSCRPALGEAPSLP